MNQMGPLVAACAKQFSKMVDYGDWFLFLSLIAALVVTAVSVIERLAALRKPPVENEAGGGDAGTFFQALQGLITALGQAPAWFAIFLAGLALLWGAPTFYGPDCRVLTPPESENSATPEDPAGNSMQSPGGEKE